MCYIVCKKSNKTGRYYLVLIVNDVYVTFDRVVIEKLAMSYGISNIELNDMKCDEKITLI